MTVKANQKTLHRQIASQFKGKRMIPFVATDQEISHGRNTTWTLRAKEAPETADRSRRPICSSPACAPPQKRCCNWCETAGALNAGTGSVTPSSTRMATATGAQPAQTGRLSVIPSSRVQSGPSSSWHSLVSPGGKPPVVLESPSLDAPDPGSIWWPSHHGHSAPPAPALPGASHHRPTSIRSVS